MREYPINKPGGIEVKGIKSGTFTLTEREIKSLLRRFDPDNYVYDEEKNHWTVSGKCILCTRDDRERDNRGGDCCTYCPIDQFASRGFGAACTVFLEAISGEDDILKFHATQKGMVPVRKRKALQKIQAFLTSGKKVR